jgi:hypothetical protein
MVEMGWSTKDLESLTIPQYIVLVGELIKKVQREEKAAKKGRRR